MLLALSRSADACACCAEHDTFSQQTGLSEYMVELLHSVPLGAGRILEGPGPIDPVIFTGDDTTSAGTHAAGVIRWTVGESRATFRYEAAAGALMQVDAESYRPVLDRPAGELYVQLRLPGTLTFEGPLGAKIPAGPAELLLQGRGNQCPSAEGFYRWGLYFSRKLATEHASFVMTGPIRPEAVNAP